MGSFSVLLLHLQAHQRSRDSLLMQAAITATTQQSRFHTETLEAVAQVGHERAASNGWPRWQPAQPSPAGLPAVLGEWCNHLDVRHPTCWVKSA